MRGRSLDMLETVAEGMEDMLDQVVFIGGASASLLIDDGRIPRRLAFPRKRSWPPAARLQRSRSRYPHLGFSAPFHTILTAPANQPEDDA